MTSGGQCVMIAGAVLMLPLSASSWDMQPLEVSVCMYIWIRLFKKICYGCSSGGIAYSSARFGVGTGPIYLDDVGCTSSASQLLECSSRPILTHNCLHSADAGVGCDGMQMKVSY